MTDQGQPRLSRPFIVVGGRAAAGRKLDVATLLRASELAAARYDGLSPEGRQIVGLCRTIQSLAEVAAHLGLPLGVVRVLVADLADRNLLSIASAPPPPPSQPPDPETLRKVLSGLRRL